MQSARWSFREFLLIYSTKICCFRFWLLGSYTLLILSSNYKITQENFAAQQHAQAKTIRWLPQRGQISPVKQAKHRVNQRTNSIANKNRTFYTNILASTQILAADHRFNKQGSCFGLRFIMFINLVSIAVWV